MAKKVTLKAVTYLTKKYNIPDALERLEAMQIAGDAYHDQGLFVAAHQIIIAPTATMTEKAKAMAMIDRAMGVAHPLDITNIAAVTKALAEYLEMLG